MTKLLLISIIFMAGCAKKPALQTKAVSTNADQTQTAKAQIDFIRREFIKFKLCWPMKSTDDSDVSEADWVAQLRREVAKRNLRWEVGCKFDEDWKFDPNLEDYYFGYAEDGNTPTAKFYVEEGAKPSWVVRGRSQEQAAIALLHAIQGPPNLFPEHEPPNASQKHKP